MTVAKEAFEVFYCYAYEDDEDERLRKKLEKHLSSLKRQGLIKDWHARQIIAGTEWADAINDHLNTASIILLLIIPDFMDSDSCYAVEMKRAMERHNAKEAQVIPIIMRPTDIEGAPFEKLQSLPDNAKPVTTWHNEDEAFADVALGIRKVVEKLRSQQGKTRQGQLNLTYQSEKRSSLSSPPLPDASLDLHHDHHQGMVIEPKMKRWDVFVSYASEDKELVALPLAEALSRAGLKVWLDSYELRMGDSLREKIDEGLSKSSFGVVILSDSFLAKRWPQRELNGLMAIEEAGHKTILPVWHNIDQATLTQYSPILADRLAANTAKGIDNVAREIVEVILASQSTYDKTSVGRLFIELLGRIPGNAEIKDFLSYHPSIIWLALGGGSKSLKGGFEKEPLWSVSLDQFNLDCCSQQRWSTLDRIEWYIILFETLSADLFLSQLKPVQSLADKITLIENLRLYIRSNLRAAREKLPRINPDFQAIIVAGRRSELDKATKENLGEYNDVLVDIKIRTYDWLVDTAIANSNND